MQVQVIGYARTSTVDQVAGLEAQLAALSAAGVVKVFQEQVSSVKVSERTQLEAAIDYARDGDVFVVTKIDRLARSLPHLLSIIARLTAKGVSLRILGLNIDTATPTGKLMVTMMGGIAEFERDMMLERQIEGIAAAKAAGKYVGRQPTARAKSADVVRLAARGITRDAIAKEVGVGIASVYRILAAEKAADAA
jgi:DNA invertase Pin-like site-specific DNA recombinase